MTAFGRASARTSLGRFQVEINTVNRRHLEINFALPRQFNRFEIEIRKWIEAKIGRGQILVSLVWRCEAGESIIVTPNLALAKALKGAWQTIAKEIGVPSEVPLSLLAEQKDILAFEDELKEDSLYLAALKNVVLEALEKVIMMREKEGEALAFDLEQRVINIEKTVEKIAANAHKATDRYRDKLKQRLEELFIGHPENEEKVLREIAVFAEKIDVTEEIVRLGSHLKQFKQLLKTPLENPIETRGKTLEFLIQELHREINTIGSKSTDLSIAQEVIFLKSELERMREQVQNIE